MKKLNKKQEKAIEDEIKMMLHAHRDCLRNQKVDTTKVTFNVNDGYYGEAFGILRALQVLGYGKFGAMNVCDNEHPKWSLNWWMYNIEREVLAEENFNGNNMCDHCCEKYGKDAVRTRPHLDKTA